MRSLCAAGVVMLMRHTTDTMETFFDSRIDLLQRQLSKQTEKLKLRAEGVIKARKVRTPGGEDIDREVRRLKLGVRDSHRIS